MLASYELPSHHTNIELITEYGEKSRGRVYYNEVLTNKNLNLTSPKPVKNIKRSRDSSLGKTEAFRNEWLLNICLLGNTKPTELS